MTYLRPPLFQRRVFNPLAARFGIGGAESLTVEGRFSHQPRTVPVIPVERDGKRYLVSARGDSHWVRNLRVAGRCALTARGATSRFVAAELPEEERPPVIDSYRRAAGRSVNGYFRKLPTASDHPVFRLDAETQAPS